MLKVQGLTCGYKAGFLLKDVNVRASRAEMIGVIGPNGSGKTTLLRAISRVVETSSGSIWLEGRDIGRLTPRQLAQKIAVVARPQEDDAKITVEEYALLGRIPHRRGLGLVESKEDFEAAGAAMRLSGVFHLKERFISDLSSGERQLASIARAIAQEPKLLLLDEPTSHLDIAHQIRILDLIKRLNRETGLTVIIVLHDLNLAAQYCDRLLLLEDGCLRKEGTPEEVLTYELIESVYDTVVIVRNNPISSKPYVILVSESERTPEDSLRLQNSPRDGGDSGR
jgi:iron complex transport system ATP-binding protein